MGKIHILIGTGKDKGLYRMILQTLKGTVGALPAPVH